VLQPNWHPIDQYYQTLAKICGINQVYGESNLKDIEKGNFSLLDWFINI